MTHSSPTQPAQRANATFAPAIGGLNSVTTVTARSRPIQQWVARAMELRAPEYESMERIVQYKVEVSCDPCPPGTESRILTQLQSAFPVTSCLITEDGLIIRMVNTHVFADGSLKDFADLVGKTLSDMGITMTTGVVRQVTSQPPCQAGMLTRMQDFAATFVGVDRVQPIEVPVLYFYKGLRFDLELTARLRGQRGRSRMESVQPV